MGVGKGQECVCASKEILKFRKKERKNLFAESKRGEGAKAKQRAESKRGTKQNETKQNKKDTTWEGFEPRVCRMEGSRSNHWAIEALMGSIHSESLFHFREPFEA